MAKILTFNVPTSGHVNPTLPVIAELTRRGHTVIYWLTEPYRAAIEGTGAEFRPYDDRIPPDYFERRGLDGSLPPYTAQTLAETSLALMPDLLALVEAEEPDAILHDSMCPWGWLLGKITGLPTVSSNSLLFLTPDMIFRDAGLLDVAALMGRSLPYFRSFGQIARRIERTYSLRMLSAIDFLTTTGTITLSYTSSMFQPKAHRLDPRIKFVGPSIEAGAHEPDFPWGQLDDRPLIYISLGTVINQNAAFYRECLQAFAGSTHQVVISVGKRTDIDSLGAIPPNYTVRNFVPQLELLPKASLFITHAGMNSVQESLLHDVPLLLVPQQMEQKVVAARVQRLGAGRTLSNGDVNAERLRTLVDAMMEDASLHEGAQILGESLRTAGGYRRAVDEIESIFSTG